MSTEHEYSNTHLCFLVQRRKCYLTDLCICQQRLASRAQAEMRVSRFVFDIHVRQTNKKEVLASDKRILLRVYKQSSAIKQQNELVKYKPCSPAHRERCSKCN